jgi:hypothetical protein
MKFSQNLPITFNFIFGNFPDFCRVDKYREMYLLDRFELLITAVIQPETEQYIRDVSCVNVGRRFGTTRLLEAGGTGKVV